MTDLATLEAELAAARAAAVENFNRPIGGSLRTKQHGIRVDAAVRRAAELVRTAERLERELSALRNPQPEPAPLNLARLPYARYIRTTYGWYEVVKVNRATVKVVAAPGMDDLVKVAKILEIREA